MNIEPSPEEKKSRKPSVPWTLDEAIPVVRRFEEALIQIGYHCALGGSVLHSGRSDKDLDVFVYPHDTKNVLPPEQIMLSIDNSTELGLAYGACNPEYMDRDGKDVWWSYDDKNRRIDFFFLA